MFKELIKTIKKNIGIVECNVEQHNTELRRTNNNQKNIPIATPINDNYGNNIPFANSYIVNDLTTYNYQSSRQTNGQIQPLAPSLDYSTGQTNERKQPSAPPLNYSTRQTNEQILPSAPPLDYLTRQTNEQAQTNNYSNQTNKNIQQLQNTSETDNSSHICYDFGREHFVDILNSMLKNAIFSSRKKDAIYAINRNELSIKDLKDALKYLDECNIGTPKNKTRPFIRKMLIDKINNMEKDL